VLVVDSVAIGSLLVLRARQPEAPFRVPLYPFVPVAFIAVYIALFVGAALAQPGVVAIGTGVLVAAFGLSWLVPRGATQAAQQQSFSQSHASSTGGG